MFGEKFRNFEQLFWKLLIKTLIPLFMKQQKKTYNNRKSSNFDYFLIFYFLFDTVIMTSFQKIILEILEIIIQNKTNNRKK